MKMSTTPLRNSIRLEIVPLNPIAPNNVLRHQRSLIDSILNGIIIKFVTF